MSEGVHRLLSIGAFVLRPHGWECVCETCLRVVSAGELSWHFRSELQESDHVVCFDCLPIEGMKAKRGTRLRRDKRLQTAVEQCQPTLREYIATACMLRAFADGSPVAEWAAARAVKFADAMIAELNKSTPDKGEL